jgi:hypothetical protein
MVQAREQQPRRRRPRCRWRTQAATPPPSAAIPARARRQVPLAPPPATCLSPLARLAASPAAERQERSVRGSCFSAEGGGSASWIRANADRRFGRAAAARRRRRRTAPSVTEQSSRPAVAARLLSGQSRQRRALVQHCPSGLKALDGAASPTSAAAGSPPRKRPPRRRRGRHWPGRGMSPERLRQVWPRHDERSWAAAER